MFSFTKLENNYVTNYKLRSCLQSTFTLRLNKEDFREGITKCLNEVYNEHINTLQHNQYLLE